MIQYSIVNIHDSAGARVVSPDEVPVVAVPVNKVAQSPAVEVVGAPPTTPLRDAVAPGNSQQISRYVALDTVVRLQY